MKAKQMILLILMFLVFCGGCTFSVRDYAVQKLIDKRQEEMKKEKQ
jgi:hypothetical protein